MADTYDVTIRRSTGESWQWIGIPFYEADDVWAILGVPTITEGIGAEATTQPAHGESSPESGDL